MTTHILLSLNHYFRSEDTDEGWEFCCDGDTWWQSESDEAETLDAMAVHQLYEDGDYTYIVETPELVGDEQLLRDHAKSFGYRFPEGFRIVQIPCILPAKEVTAEPVRNENNSGVTL